MNSGPKKVKAEHYSSTALLMLSARIVQLC